MTKTYAALKKQIEALTLEAEALKRKEVEGVVARIQEAIAAYGLTAEDLGFGAKRAQAGVAGKRAGAKKRAPARGKAAGAGATAKVAYRDEAGNTWVGRGPRPHWLRDALAAGKTLEDFKAK